MPELQARSAKPPRPAKPAEHAPVSPIRKRGRIPKKNRPEDAHAIAIGSLARRLASRAYELAQTEPNSERHRLTLHMSGIAKELPINNLRVLTTRDDMILGVWRLWHILRIANLEWELCEARRMEACRDNDEDARAAWTQKTKDADQHRWRVYERMVRVPAKSLNDFNHYKLDRRFQGGMGSLEWMRRYKPDLAAVLDEEHARLVAEKDARKAKRAAKREAGQ